MFPTTVWTTIQKARDRDPAALEGLARDYLAPVRRYIESRGFAAADAEDLTQEVFVRVLGGGVLARADATQGRFRSLLLAIATHVMQHRWRRRTEETRADLEVADRDPDFDRAWILHLAERAMVRLREVDSPYYEVLRRHLAGDKPGRNKLWIARRKLRALIRDEIARTCSSAEQLAEETGYLAGFLRPISDNS